MSEGKSALAALDELQGRVSEVEGEVAAIVSAVLGPMDQHAAESPQALASSLGDRIGLQSDRLAQLLGSLVRIRTEIGG